MSKIFLASGLAMAAIGIAQTPARALDGAYPYNPTVTTADAGEVEPCQLAVTKSYKIKQGFCPQSLVYLIPSAVGPSCCSGGCGPYGIPPIYASGQYVLVRQTPAMQERVKDFLTELGALAVPPKRTY